MIKLIDKLYELKYEELREYTSKAIYIYRRNYDTQTIITDSYLYIIDKKDIKLDITIDELEAIVKTFIKNTIKWSNSYKNYKRGGGYMLNIDDVEYIKDEDNTLSMNIYDELISDFEITLCRGDKRLFNIYYHRGITSIAGIKKHLDISEHSSRVVRLECIKIYKDFRIFIEKYIKDYYEN